MTLLILGGTVFLGRHLVEAAFAHGHRVTLFNRGQHNPDLFPDVEKLRGDRHGGLDALGDRRWDAVIDTCGYVPRLVRASAERLADATDHYTFISSISVYTGPATDESAPVGRLADAAVEQINGETYGPLKALCEAAAEHAMPGLVLNVRAGLIVGPYDPTDRFTYWPARVARGGEILAPGRPGRRVQFIDVRDLAEWIVRAAGRRVVGTFNVTGPQAPLTMAQVLDACARATDHAARYTWVDDDFLLGAAVTPWTQLPLWNPETHTAAAVVSSVSSDRAITTGLTYRPLSSTISATLEWHATRPAGLSWRAGLTPAREQELLEAWRESRASNQPGASREPA